MNHQEVEHRGRPCQVPSGCTIWQWCAGGPSPSAAHRMGPVKTVISQTKLMWTSGARFAYSPTRMSSLWLPVRLEKKGSRKKKVIFPPPPLQLSAPLKSIHRWQKSPEWPYQLFYYFSHGGGWRWQVHLFSSEIRWESSHPSGVFKLSDYAKPRERCVWLRRTWTRAPLMAPLGLPSLQGHSFNTHTPSFFSHWELVGAVIFRVDYHRMFTGRTRPQRGRSIRITC